MKEDIELLDEVNYELKQLKSTVQNLFEDATRVSEYRKELLVSKQKLVKKLNRTDPNLLPIQELRFAKQSLERCVDEDSPMQIRDRYKEFLHNIENITRLHRRRNYELMSPTALLNEGKTFGE